LSDLNRRSFLRLSTAAMLTAASDGLGNVIPPTISSTHGVIRVLGDNYAWEYAEADDTFGVSGSFGTDETISK
jgi:hypothetical protein